MEKKEPTFEYLESIAEFIPASFYWFDLNSRFMNLNSRTVKAVGAQNKEDVIGKTVHELYQDQFIADEIQKDINKVIKTCKPSLVEDKIVDVTTRKFRYFSATRGPLFNKNDELIGIMGVSIETTTEKEAALAEKVAEQLKQQNIKLETQNKMLEAQNKLNQMITEKNAAAAEAERFRLENEIHKLENEKLTAAAEQQAQFRKIAAQVAHDIASPVFALQMILPHCEVLPENLRSALSKFSVRIIDIAQNFLSQFKQRQDGGLTTDGVTCVPSLIYSELIEIVTEKKYEYTEQPIKFISEINPNSYFTFANIDVDAFKRMMSNLINNAVDAFEGGDGIITVHLDTIDDKVQIIIEDNGKGMPKEIINKILNNIAVTSGKIDGYGIGFSQIRDALTNNEGTFSIDSELGHGTKIILTFPKTETPLWITDKIELNHDALMVIVDDEPYVHEAWECQFKSSAPNLSRRHFEQGEEAISFLNQLTDEEKNKVFLLTDYELLKQKLNGLDIIEKTKIESSILVTSHHNGQEIREHAANLRVKILPKELAFAVTITSPL